MFLPEVWLVVQNLRKASKEMNALLKAITGSHYNKKKKKVFNFICTKQTKRSPYFRHFSSVYTPLMQNMGWLQRP